MKIVFICVQLLLSNLALASLDFGTYNIRNFDYDERSDTPTNKQKLVETVKQMNVDLLAVQEITETHVFDYMVKTNFQGRYKTILSYCGGSHDQRLGFIYDQRKLEVIRFEEDMRTVNPSNQRQSHCRGSRPLAIAKFRNKITGKTFVAISVHLKSGGMPKHISKRFKQISILAKVVKHYQTLGQKNIVIMGDFNSTEYIFKGREYKKFNQIVKSLGLIDISANLKCTAYWWGGKDDFKQYPSQLDHILVSPSFLGSRNPKVQSLAHCQKQRCRETLEDTFGSDFTEVSDHCPLVAKSK